MTTRKITSFISSENRQPNEAIYNFSVDYPDGILTCKDNETMELNVLSFDMPNTMYNINSTNDHFQITLDNADNRSIHLKHGNYSVKTLLKEFQEKNLEIIKEINFLTKKNDFLSVNINKDYLDEIYRDYFVLGKKGEKIYIINQK